MNILCTFQNQTTGKIYQEVREVFPDSFSRYTVPLTAIDWKEVTKAEGK